MLRPVLLRALPLLGLPLLAACPTFSYGPEAFEIEADPLDCEGVGLEATCTRFELDNGTIFTSPVPQSVWLRLGFEADHRNLEDLVLEYEIPGRSPVRVACPLTGEVVDMDAGDDGVPEVEDGSEPSWAELGCRAPQLADATETTLTSPAEAAQGVLELEALVLAEQAGSYAISAWLTDANGLESPTVRWQFPVVDPVRPDPAPPSE